MNTTAGITAARAVNAHPWLSAVTPDPDDADTDLLISRAYNPGDEVSGYVEGRVTWNHTGDGRVTYLVTLAYEPHDGDATTEDQLEATIDPNAPFGWLDLARTVAVLAADLMGDLHAPATA